MKFISEIFLSLKSGAGGDGVISWRRESRTPHGGPAGGNGGNGGSVYIIANINVDSLFHLRHIQFFEAESGENGKNKSQHGKNGKDLYIQVPLGTNIYNRSKTEKLGELLKDKEVFLAVSGGKGGFGNAHFKSANNPTPFLYERGDMSKEIDLFLELEFISDVGFLGMPNAGKSTLLSVISNAKPKIASFPFTTLIPVLGSVTFKNKKLIFSDIPGLIENASEGAGLGFEFLKHLNRCKVLAQIVDISSESLVEDISSIRNELQKYSELLYNKPYFLCLNKIDLLLEKQLLTIKKKIEKLFGVETVFISAKEKKNIDLFLAKSFSLYEKNNFPLTSKIDYLEISDDPNMFAPLKIKKQDNFWEVEHPFLKYWIYKIPATTHDNRARLLRKIESLEVKKSLLAEGAQEGEEIKIYDFSFPL